MKPNCPGCGKEISDTSSTVYIKEVGEVPETWHAECFVEKRCHSLGAAGENMADEPGLASASSLGIRRRTGTDLIAAARRRQILRHGYGIEHDLRSPAGRLLFLALDRLHRSMLDQYRYEEQASKPGYDHNRRKEVADVINLLAQSGALIAAEIDRIRALEEALQDTEKIQD